MKLLKNTVWPFCLFLVIMAASFMACGSSDSANETGRIELTYWSANNQFEINLARALVAEWNAAHPDIHITHQSVPEGTSSEEVILSAVVSKTTPDIYSNIWPGDVQLYVDANALVPLDQFSDCDSVFADRFEPHIIQEARSLDGHTYQVPWKTNPIMICYNKKLLRQAGYETFPKTYSAFFDAAEKITADLNGDGYVDRWMGISDIRVTWWQRFFDFYALYIAASNGNTLVKGNKVLFENKAAEQVFAFLQTNFRKGYFPKEKTAGRTDIFLQDVVATRFTGPWTIMHNEKFKPDGFEYDFAPLPRPDDMAQGPTFTYGDFKNIVIFSTTQHPKAAWEFVKFIISRQSDQQLLQITNQLPLRQNIASDSSFTKYFEQNPRMKIFANQAKTVRGADMSPVLKEVFDAISQEYETCVVYGARTPEEAVKRAAKRVRLILQ